MDKCTKRTKKSHIFITSSFQSLKSLSFFVNCQVTSSTLSMSLRDVSVNVSQLENCTEYESYLINDEFIWSWSVPKARKFFFPVITIWNVSLPPAKCQFVPAKVSGDQVDDCLCFLCWFCTWVCDTDVYIVETDWAWPPAWSPTLQYHCVTTPATSHNTVHHGLWPHLLGEIGTLPPSMYLLNDFGASRIRIHFKRSS